MEFGDSETKNEDNAISENCGRVERLGWWSWVRKQTTKQTNSFALKLEKEPKHMKNKYIKHKIKKEN